MEQVTDGSSEACRLFKVDFPNDLDYPIRMFKNKC